MHGRPVVERRHVSFSAMNNFANCPRKFYAYEVVKRVKEPESPQMKEGMRVHKAMADYVTKGTPLPTEYAGYADWVKNMVTGCEGEGEVVKVEHQMACTFGLFPCEWFSRVNKVWLRAQADLLVMNGGHALSVDWKTGKEPDERYELLPKNFQLRITAMMVFLHFPKIQSVTSKYVYLSEGTQTSFDMPRSDLRLFIPMVYDEAAKVQHAVNDDAWPPRPSGLCIKHCAVSDCEYWGKGNRR
jgi:CRISPR/Cas system-associated exonuclease Cas4 (RecB family)